MTQPNTERRNFLRHPIQVPIRFRIPPHRGPSFLAKTEDISAGGLSFSLSREFPEGTLLDVTIPLRAIKFNMIGSVAYCRQDSKSGLFKVGILFHEDDMSFRAKLAAEILKIEEFRKETSRRLGREVSREDAAHEWIQKYAEEFSKFSE
ncbi:MAG TPA: PilZ domain-containing protein [Candidatus Omnitrophota bacterium]|nr:PilZ domain-containing protein [Candidatus Omnitrophota bacterium]